MKGFKVSATCEEKMEIVTEIIERLFDSFGEQIVALGLCEPSGANEGKKCSDIKIYMIVSENGNNDNYEFIYKSYKVEIIIKEKSEYIKSSINLDSRWPIAAAEYIDVKSIYDSEGVFEEVKTNVLEIDFEKLPLVMTKFIVDRIYKLVGAINDSFHNNKNNHLPFCVMKFVWESAKLIGIANNTYYESEDIVLEKSLTFPMLPEGYEELTALVMQGQLDDYQEIYKKCEILWEGINNWMDMFGVSYMLEELPF